METEIRMKTVKKVAELFFEIEVNCSLEKPKEGLYVAIGKDAEAEGYTLCINSSIIPESSYECIESIIQKYKLRMKKSKEYLVIYKPK
ncbi:MAG: hypothetical protein OEZ35_04560 [Candidatus Bathyarchaeota archaeon]|nr:hypothetical protein [Candidatus Bathyarchaeota archaeon]